jgi:hypothetical protein
MAKNQAAQKQQPQSAPVTPAPAVQPQAVAVAPAQRATPADYKVIPNHFVDGKDSGVPETGAQTVVRYGGISNAIRAMSAEGYPKGQIAKHLGKRFQHVRNVLARPLKRTPAAEASAAPTATK